MILIKFCVTIIVSVLFILDVKGYLECNKRYFGYDSFVCVCNETYCDFQSKPKNIPRGKFLWLASDRDALRMKRQDGSINNYLRYRISPNILKIRINHTRRYQKIHGWGGSVTDAAGINIMSITQESRNKLIKSYFSKEGIDYNIIRTPVGGSDMSIRPYTLDDAPNDTDLKNFSLQNEDYNYKIPVIHAALNENPELKVIATAWSSPGWMKVNKKVNGPDGILIRKYYESFANYYMKFLDAYKSFGIDVWMISPSNEPLSADLHSEINNILWPFNDSAKWITEYMGPKLAASKHKTKICTLEDQRPFINDYMNSLYSDPRVQKYVHAIGLHWYFDYVVKPELLDEIHKKFPDKFLLMTEACTGYFPWEEVNLGSWKRVDQLLIQMFQNFNHWISGWIDWNLALNDKGGPSYIENYLDAPIIVNAERNEFYKQPLFYAVGHFSKFIPKNSVKISSTDTPRILTAAFETPDKQTVVQIYNTKIESQRIYIIDERNNLICVKLSPKSINTIIYKK